MTASELQRHLVDLSRRRTNAEADHRAAHRRLLSAKRVAAGRSASPELIQRRDAAQSALGAAQVALDAVEAEYAAAARIPVTADPPPPPARRSSTVIGLTH